MKAVGYKKPLPIGSAESFMDIEMSSPTASGRDLLVKVEAISVNLLDVKVRASAAPEGMPYRIMGWNAAGVVVGVGSESKLFKVGDEVYYAESNSMVSE